MLINNVTHQRETLIEWPIWLKTSQVSAILKFDFQKRKQLLRFSEENCLKYTKDQILHVITNLI